MAVIFYGDPLPKDEEYYDSIKIRAKKFDLEGKTNFYKAILIIKLQIYRRYDIFVNLTPSGSFDKTILEAILCGCIRL